MTDRDEGTVCCQLNQQPSHIMYSFMGIEVILRTWDTILAQLFKSWFGMELIRPSTFSSRCWQLLDWSSASGSFNHGMTISALHIASRWDAIVKQSSQPPFLTSAGYRRWGFSNLYYCSRACWKRRELIGIHHQPNGEQAICLVLELDKSILAARDRNKRKIVNFELFTLQLQPNCTCNYSKNDIGPSEMGTESNRHFYKGCFSRSEIIGFPIVLIQLKPPGRGQPLQKGHKQLNLYCPMHPEVLLYMHASRLDLAFALASAHTMLERPASCALLEGRLVYD